MTPGPETLRKCLIDRASEPYQAAGRFAYHFDPGKLGADPVLCGLLARGLVPRNARILDLGYVQGLPAAWLLAARQVARHREAEQRCRRGHGSGSPVRCPDAVQLDQGRAIYITGRIVSVNGGMV
jgi:hypothetical protein